MKLYSLANASVTENTLIPEVILATASGAKVIALYGPTSPLLNGPRGPQTNFKVIWENPCLENLTPQRVLTEIENWKILYEKNIISSK